MQQRLPDRTNPRSSSPPSENRKHNTDGVLLRPTRHSGRFSEGLLHRRSHKQFGLSDQGALSADRLAKELRVTVWSTSEVAGLTPTVLSVLNDKTDQSWSALTMRLGASHLVVFKPVSSNGLRNNVIMHELAHIILGHELATACILEDGSLVPGNFDQDQEDEADWLAGALLLPRSALLSIRRRQLSDHAACKEHLVSLEMLKWRFRMTGVDYQLSRRRA